MVTSVSRFLYGFSPIKRETDRGEFRLIRLQYVRYSYLTGIMAVINTRVKRIESDEYSFVRSSIQWMFEGFLSFYFHSKEIR